MGIRITTWNVNGIRNPFGYQPWCEKRTFDAMFDTLEADIVVMQELKIQRKDLRDDMVLVPGWDCYFSLPRQKKGYSGVGIYTRQQVCSPIRAEEGLMGVLCPPNSKTPYCELPEDQHVGGYPTAAQLADLDVDAAVLDAEGRCVVLEFSAFVILGIYSPANSSGLRDDFRHCFQSALDMRIRNLIKTGKRVVVCGDLNVSRETIDTANSEENMKKEGITLEEYVSTPNRRIFNQLLEGGIVYGERDEGRESPAMWDVCRGFHPTRKGMFTHWEQKINARPGNFGSRIDFVLCSLDMKSWFCESDIQEGLMGSDHCPVYAIMKEKVHVGDHDAYIQDLMNPVGVFVEGKRRDVETKIIPAFSARLMPEFSQRRSIRDMFGRKPAALPTSTSSLETEKGLDGNTNIVGEDGPASRVPISTELLPSSQQTSSTVASTPMPSPERKRPVPSASPKQTKRSKPNANAVASVAPNKGQQSLKGFFKPKDSAVGKIETPMSISSTFNESRAALADTTNASESSILTAAAMNSSSAVEELESAKSASEKDEENIPLDDEPFIDPEASKESWSKLFTKRSPPRCEHEEPCKMMKTKKPGFNCGRDFWMCARPLGPTGTKEKNTQWRCPTFIWSSEWNG